MKNPYLHENCKKQIHFKYVEAKIHVVVVFVLIWLLLTPINYKCFVVIALLTTKNVKNLNENLYFYIFAYFILGIYLKV